MVSLAKTSVRSLLSLTLAYLGLLVIPCHAQTNQVSRESLDSTGQLLAVSDYRLSKNTFDLQTVSSPLTLYGISFSRPLGSSPLARNLAWENSVTMVDRMEAAFYCNDTPFIDQVRLPLASMWGGRIKLTGFESDVTTANFVLGLPGGGTLHSLSMFGSGHLAMRTPPSDQLAGINMVFTFRGREVGAMDNSGFHGLQYVMRASRGLLQSVSRR